MSSEDLERVAAAQHSADVIGAEHLGNPVPPTELQIAVASAVSHGEPLAVVAEVADLPSLAVLDAVDAHQPKNPGTPGSPGRT